MIKLLKLLEYEVNVDDENYIDRDFWGGGLGEIKQFGSGDNLGKLLILIQKYDNATRKIDYLKDIYKNYVDRYGRTAVVNSVRIIRGKIDTSNLESWKKDPDRVKATLFNMEQTFQSLKKNVRDSIKQYYKEKRSKYRDTVDPSIVALKKIYQEDLGGEEILSEIKQLPNISSKEIYDLIHKIIQRNEYLLLHYRNAKPTNDFPNLIDKYKTRNLMLDKWLQDLSPIQLSQFYNDLKKFIEKWDLKIDIKEIYTDNDQGEEIYGS